MQYYIENYLQAIFIFGLIGGILAWTAKSYGFFHLPHFKEEKTNLVSFKTVIVVFSIYLGMTMVIAPLIAHHLRPFFQTFSQSTLFELLSLLQLLTLGCIFLLFYLYCKALSPHLFGRIWKDRSVPHAKSISVDFLLGIATWLIGFPFVVVIGQLADMSLYFFFEFKSYEQVAVRYLKTTLGSPEMLTVALITILIAAPIIEEFMFRGCLQTYFKRYTSPKNAIILSALCFSLFHFSSSQGVGNISLIASLFLFALFLGFIYERQASLFASIGLHMTFNTVSTLRILFFPE
jgi:membrane protease YdiL (CAAX protease family)